MEMSSDDHEMQARTFLEFLGKHAEGSWDEVFDEWADSKQLGWADHFAIWRIVDQMLTEAA